MFSPAKDYDVYGIHFTWVHDFEGVYKTGAKIVQDHLTGYDYRVHWGKFFHYRSDIWKTLHEDRQYIHDKILVMMCNCWCKRIVFGHERCFEDGRKDMWSNYEVWADEVDEVGEWEKAADPVHDEL